MKKDPWFRNHLIRDAIYHAIYDRMRVDDSIYLMGEGSHMKIHFDCPAIEKEFPERVITLPISEDANTNFALGMALAGVKPIVDVITADFLYRTMDSICNTVAKTNFVSEPRTIVIRAEFMTAGPTTGQRPEALFTHIPGLNVVIPSNPVDARGLMDAALKEKGCTLFFEDRMIEDATTRKEDMDEGELESIPLGKAKIIRMGTQTASGSIHRLLTVLSYGITLRMLELMLEKEDLALDYELIDLRSIYPVDWETIFDSVSRTDSLLIVEPDVMYSGVGAEIAAQVAERGAEVRRLGAPRMTIPASRSLHGLMLPSEDEIVKMVEEMSG